MRGGPPKLSGDVSTSDSRLPSGTRITNVLVSCSRTTRRSCTYQAGRAGEPLRLASGSDSAYRPTSSGVTPDTVAAGDRSPEGIEPSDAVTRPAAAA